MGGRVEFVGRRVTKRWRERERGHTGEDAWAVGGALARVGPLGPTAESGGLRGRVDSVLRVTPPIGNFRMRKSIPCPHQANYALVKTQLSQCQRHGTMAFQFDSCPSDTSRELVKLAEEFGWRLVGARETTTTSSTRRAGL